MIHPQFSGIVMVLTMTLLPGTLPPATSSQEWAVSYTAKQLHCARFLETVASEILTEAGGRTRRQTADRRGVWQFRAAPSNDDVALEGWLDSLVLSRRSPETTISPDTDGLLGGRYRGTLSRTGAYTAQVRPFVPDEVAEVAGMENAIEDLFPPLPGRVLQPGESWSDSTGVTLKRLPDSALSGVPLYRFELDVRTEALNAPSGADTLPLELQQKTREHGQFVWHPLLGLVRRERSIVVETTVPPSRTVRQAVRSKVEQWITLVRDLGPVGCRPGSAGQ